MYRREGTTSKVLGAIATAAQAGVRLIVFPETFIPYDPYFSCVEPPVLMGKAHMLLYEQAVTVPGPVVDAVSRAARSSNMVVVLGVNKREEGSPYNTQLIFDADGTLLSILLENDRAHLTKRDILYGVLGLTTGTGHGQEEACSSSLI